MRLRTLLFSTLIFLCSFLAAQETVTRIGNVNYLNNTVIAKLEKGKSINFISSTDNFQRISGYLGSLQSDLLFPNAFKQRTEENEKGQQYADLTRVVIFTYSAEVDLAQAIGMIRSLGCFEYVEGKVVHDLAYVPNDPKASNQYHLDKIQAYAAWDEEKGDTNVVIGITDTGIKLNHDEFKDDLAYNRLDPVNGVDDDFDGYIDNYNGWDLAENDNDPSWQVNQHGVWVAGMANAATDNDDEGASIGFRTKILPVKIISADGYLTHSYEGIVYAADHGADIINCSWGSEGGYSNLGQDVVDYATINKGALVVAAAGNSNNSNYFYPASFKGVVAVGGTDPDDGKWINKSDFGSNYNDLVDVSAPSDNVVTTTSNGNTAMIGDGTSFASPIVAGVAALLKSKYPEASPEELTGRIVMTADDIYNLPANANFQGKLGSGRVNAFRALTENNHAYLSVINSSIEDGVGNSYAPGSTVNLSLDIYNHLADASGVTVTIRSDNSNINITDSIASIGDVNSKTSETGDFVFEVTSGASGNAIVNISVIISDGSNIWTDQITFTVNKDYIDITINNVDFSFNNYGRVGYTFSNEGLGIQYKEQGSLINEMGLMMSTKSSDVKFYRDYELLGFDAPKIVDNEEADITAIGTFDDMWSANPTGLEIEQKAMAWTAERDENYAIYEYTIRNSTDVDFDSVYLGLFSDWKMSNTSNESVSYDNKIDMAIITGDNGVVAGIATLRSVKEHFYAFNESPIDGSINAQQGFSDMNQYAALTGGVQRSNASGEVQTLNGQGPFEIVSGDSIVLAFAIVLGESTEALKTSAKQAQRKYTDLRGISININDLRGVSCNGKADGAIDLEVEAPLGLISYEWFHSDNLNSTSIDNLAGGLYSITATDRNGIEKSLNLNVNEPSPLVLEVNGNVEVGCNQKAQVESMVHVYGGTENYDFDWNDASIPGIASPDLDNGTYWLTVTDANGCQVSDSVSIDNPEPIVIDVLNKVNDTTESCLGAIALNLVGGEGELDVIWDHDPSLKDVNLIELCENKYTVLVTDENNCQSDKTIEILGQADVLSSSRSDNFVNASKLYPNPSRGTSILEFDLLKSQFLHISIINGMGQEVTVLGDQMLSSGHAKVIVTTFDLEAGQYYIHLTSDTNREVIPITVIK